jgi:hypothetical protein
MHRYIMVMMMSAHTTHTHKQVPPDYYYANKVWREEQPENLVARKNEVAGFRARPPRQASDRY